MLKLELLAGPDGCAGKSCPTIYKTDRGTVVVQGYTVTEATTAALGPGESLVEIPAALIDELLASRS